MKKVVIAVAVLAVAVGAVVGAYGAGRGWFSGGKPDGQKPPETRPSTERPDRPPTYEDPKVTITTQGLARLESLKKASDTDMAKALVDWGKQAGIERKISWEAVCKGALPEEEGKTRRRACQLASALSARPAETPAAPACDERAVEPLMSCVRSGDAGLVAAGLTALCAMNLAWPELKVGAKVLPEVRRLLASPDAGMAAAALAAVPLLKAVDLVLDIVAAWEKHAAVEGFADKCCPRLRTLVELDMIEKVRLEHPDWPRSRSAQEGKLRAERVFEELGTDPAKWRAYWAKPAGADRGGRDRAARRVPGWARRNAQVLHQCTRHETVGAFTTLIDLPPENWSR